MRYEPFGRSAQMHVEEIQRLEGLEDSLLARMKLWQSRYYEMQEARDRAVDYRRAEFEATNRKLLADLANKEESLRKLRDIVACGSYESGRIDGLNEAKTRMDLVEREAHEVAMAEMTRRLEGTHKDRIQRQATAIGKLQNERGEVRAQCSALLRKLDEARADNREKSAYWSKQVDDAKREISALSEELDEERGQRGTTRLNEANKRIKDLEKCLKDECKSYDAMSVRYSSLFEQKKELVTRVRELEEDINPETGEYKAVEILQVRVKELEEARRSTLAAIPVIDRLHRWERALSMEVDAMKVTSEPLPVAGALLDIAKCVRAILDGHEPTF